MGYTVTSFRSRCRKGSADFQSDVPQGFNLLKPGQGCPDLNPGGASVPGGLPIANPLPLGFERASTLCPGGTNDNSPTFQRWVWRSFGQVPKGRPTSHLSRPFGTWLPVIVVPTLKRWAICSHPSGMKIASSRGLQIANRRYGRLIICATWQA